MRAFVRLREILATHKEIAIKLEEVEKKYDAQFRVVSAEIRKLMQPASIPLKRQIGLIPRKREVVGFEVAICGLKNFSMRPRCEKHHVPLRRIFTKSGKLLWLCQYRASGSN